MMRNVKESKLVYYRMLKTDIETLENIKQKYGLNTTSDAVRMAVRNFQGVKTK